MSKTRYLTLFAAAYFLGLLIITAPASLLDQVTRRISHERLSLANSQGTIWHGSATPILLTDKDSTIALHTLHWNIRPQAWLLGKLKAELDWDNPESVTPMELTLTRDSIILTHVLLPLPAQVISELSPYLKPAQFSGNLTFESPQLAYTDHHLQGKATATWNQAGSAMSAVHPLGDYQINIVAVQDSLRATLSTQSGALLLDGQGNWSPQQGFHFNGTARATAAAQPMLSELLHHLGPETAPDIYKISL
ncbi:MAG: type II secretion system protein N [Gallionella sp.]